MDTFKIKRKTQATQSHLLIAELAAISCSEMLT